MEDPLRYLRISRVLSFVEGQVIYGPGDPATSIFLIILGKVKVGRIAKNGRETISGVYKADNFFGESALIEPYRSGLASALEDTKVMAWTSEQIEAIGMESPRLLYALLQMMTNRLAHVEKHIESFTGDVRHRLARALIEFSEESTGEPINGATEIGPLTHGLFSSYIGTSREVVTKFMNQFRRQGYIDYSRNGIMVFRNRLEQLLSGENNVPGAPSASVGPCAARGCGEFNQEHSKSLDIVESR